VCVEYWTCPKFKLSVLGHVAFISIGHFGIGGEKGGSVYKTTPVAYFEQGEKKPCT